MAAADVMSLIMKSMMEGLGIPVKQHEDTNVRSLLVDTLPVLYQTPESTAACAAIADYPHENRYTHGNIAQSAHANPHYVSTAYHDIVVTDNTLYGVQPGHLFVHSRATLALTQIVPLPNGVVVDVCQFDNTCAVLLYDNQRWLTVVMVDTRTPIVDTLQIVRLNQHAMHKVTTCDHVVYVGGPWGITVYCLKTMRYRCITVPFDISMIGRGQATNLRGRHVLALGKIVVFLDPVTLDHIGPIPYSKYVMSAIDLADELAILCLDYTQSAAVSVMFADCDGNVTREISIDLKPTSVLDAVYDVVSDSFVITYDDRTVSVRLDGTYQAYQTTNVRRITPQCVIIKSYERKTTCVLRQSVQLNLALVMKKLRWRFPGHLATWMHDEFILGEMFAPDRCIPHLLDDTSDDSIPDLVGTI